MEQLLVYYIYSARGIPWVF